MMFCFMKFLRILFYFFMLLIFLRSDGLLAQTDEERVPVIIEAEDGDSGGEVNIGVDGNDTYITGATNSTAMSPERFSRVVSYDVDFLFPGSYDFYVRLKVGAGGFDDDSFFYGTGFGDKDASVQSDWNLVNGLGSAGFAEPSDLIDGPGSLGSNVWKWVNLTENGYQAAAGDPFIVNESELQQLFQIGFREDGLRIDKFAFGRSDLYFTVEMLDKGLPGSPDAPEEDTTGVLWPGPALAEGLEKFLGCGWDGADPDFTKYWTQITPGNAGKWGSVASTPNSAQWNWARLDQAYKLAKDNDLVFKNHTLVWGQQQPGWITNSGLDSAQQAAAVEEWIRLVGERYPEMDMIDVVNEPILSHNPAPYRNALGGAGETGWDWVVWSFEKARQYMPNTQLILNDYGIINDNSATTLYLQIIKVLQDRGLIDAIGVQGHRFELERAAVSTLKNNLDRLAATGLPIYISEFDLGNLGNSGTPDDDQQLELYKRIFPVLWEHPGVKGITIWGYREGEVWQSSTYLVRHNGRARPAFMWLAEYVGGYSTVNEKNSAKPTTFDLQQNYPNPFNPSTTIRYSVGHTSKISLKIFDALGREVRTLVDAEQMPGEYAVDFYADDLASGIYFYRLDAGDFRETKKLAIVK